MTAALRSLQAIPLAAALLAGVARAETRATAELYFDGGYSTNPYLQAEDDAGSASAVIRLRPEVLISGPTSDITLTGNIDRTFYSKLYDDITNWSLSGVADFRLDPRSTLALTASYVSQVNNALNTDAVEPLPTDPDISPLPDPSVPELAGQRRETFAGGAQFQTSLSPRTSLGLSATATKSDYDSPLATGYTSFGGSANVLQSFSATFSGGATITYTKTDYTNDLYGSGSFISPQLNVVAKLGPSTTLSVSGGATFSDSERPSGSSKETSFSGSVSLCRTGVRSSACLNAVRMTEATNQIGNSKVTSVSANYNYRLTPRSSIRLAGQYSSTEATGFIGNQQSRYGTAEAEYSRQISERLSFSVRAHYTKPFESISSISTRADSFFGGVSLSYRFG